MRLTGPADATPDGPARDPVAELDLGISIGLEPQAMFDDSASGVVVTRSSSWWNKTLCATCGHTFRRGDQALVDSAARTVQHLVAGIDCGIVPASQNLPADGIDRNEFAAGLLETWPSRAAVTRLAAGDWRIPRPGRGARQGVPTCLYCGHTFRPGEYVVICPCQTTQDNQAACGVAVHRDPAAGLSCWEKWQPGGTLNVCPTTTARLWPA